MDVGDSFYGVAVGFAMFVALAAQLLAIFIISFAFAVGRRLRCYLAIVALAIVGVAHLAIAFFGKGWWGKIFLGRNLPDHEDWLAIGFDHSGDVPWQSICIQIAAHAYIVLCAIKFVSEHEPVKAAVSRVRERTSPPWSEPLN